MLELQRGPRFEWSNTPFTAMRLIFQNKVDNWDYIFYLIGACTSSVQPMLHLLLQLSVSAGVCPQGQTKVDTFTYNGTDWSACEDLSTHGGALVLVNKDGKVLITYEPLVFFLLSPCYTLLRISDFFFF